MGGRTCLLIGRDQPKVVLINSGCLKIYIYIKLPVVPARGGAEVALGIYYKTFLIYRTCMRRAPARPVHACILRKWCPVSHVTLEAPLRTSHFSLHSSHSTLHTSHFHTPHFTLHTELFALRTSLHTALLRLHTSHSTLHTSQSTLHTSHTGTTTRCRTQRRNQNDPSRTRRTREVPFIAGCSHFTQKNARFRAPASSPKQSPCNFHAAITMRFAASRRKPARIYAHSNKA